MSNTTLADVEYLTTKGIHNCLEGVIGGLLETKPKDGLQALAEGVLKYCADHGVFALSDTLTGVVDIVAGTFEERKPGIKEQESVGKVLGQTGQSIPRQSTAGNMRTMVKYVQQEVGDRKKSEAKTAKNHLTQALSRSSKAATVLLETCLEMSSHQTDHMKLLKTLMEGSSSLLEADRCTFFLVEDNELVSKVAEGTDEIRVPIGTGIAGCVAKTGEVINIPDVYQDERFNKAVDLRTGYRTKSLICAPVHYQNNVIAVAQLLNKHPLEPGGDPQPFAESDLTLFEAFSAFAGVFLANSYHFRQTALEKRKNEILLDIVQRVNKTDLSDWIGVADVVKDGCKELLQAERCTLFLVDKEQGMLYADSDGTEIRMPMEQGIAGFVCTTGETVNIPDAYCDPRFNPDVDDATGFITKTILCMPIWADGEVVAVAQVINKRSGGEFAEDDEDMLRFFAAFSGLHLSNAKLLEFCRASREETMRLLTSQSGGQASHGVTDVVIQPAGPEAGAAALQVELTDADLQCLTSESFNAHLYSLKTENNHKLIPMAVHLFEKLGYLDMFNVSRIKMARFLLTAFSKYRSVPYHNMVHAFDVFHNIYIFLTRGAAKRITDLDGFVLLVSAILHDVDHMGLNNSFHSKSETPLGLLSNASGASSVLEVHHCNVAIAILSFEEIGVFSELSKDENVEAYKLLISNILKTDMASHKQVIGDYLAMAERGYNPSSLDDRRLACNVLLKAGDLSNLAKPFNVSRLWGIAITTEFYLQGDSERAEGKQVTPGFDRHTKQELAQGQMNFIQFCGLQFYKDVSMGIFPELKYMAEQVEANLAKWKSISNEG
eukprot:TRINITY_DN18313_c2_g1_i1.p1 TRINITY_DN18313_c2_g1~~TRINITY_DN18313_c2_g1_i1.p1  ORF type:complete len:832 (+),score=317.86 TRINITY_DN18313_c2_g1_i1:175-2670(+)